MSQELTEWQGIQQSLSSLLRKMSVDHITIAYQAKMTIFEMLKCQEISEKTSMPIDHVFKKMAEFKESSAFVLYKRSFA